ncbi:MAG: TetR/AcrR family transcriptional regulator [Bacteroidales bacterium]|nr:TetR/AcrR family transcriptional regulator [Bacteroidales bacterium]
MKNEEQNKEKMILEAAEDEFLTKGFDGARTVSIAQKAGVTHAMLHYYYRSKEQLFKTVLENKFYALFSIIKSSFEKSEKPVAERIKEIISIHFDFLEKNRRLPLFLLNEMGKSPETFSETIGRKFPSAHQTLFTPLVKDIQTAVSNGEIREIDPFTLIFDIISLNFFPFVALQAMEAFQQVVPFDENQFLENRKNENITLICSRLTLNQSK